MTLVTELLPPLPDSPLVMLDNLPPLACAAPPPPLPASAKEGPAPSSIASGAGAAGVSRAGSAADKTDERSVYLAANRAAVQLLAGEMLPLMLQLYTATVMPQV